MSGAAWCAEGMEKKIIDNAAVLPGPDRSNVPSREGRLELFTEDHKEFRIIVRLLEKKYISRRERKENIRGVKYSMVFSALCGLNFASFA